MIEFKTSENCMMVSHIRFLCVFFVCNIAYVFFFNSGNITFSPWAVSKYNLGKCDGGLICKKFGIYCVNNGNYKRTILQSLLPELAIVIPDTKKQVLLFT